MISTRSLARVFFATTALAPFAASAPQDRIELFADLAGPGGALVALSETSGAAAPAPFKLAELAFLPIDFQGREEVHALLPTSPRYLDDVPGASRIALPGVGGMLYRYARVAEDGSLRFGFLRVAPDGALAPVAEVEGSGGSGADDPYWPRVAIAPDGRTLLAATRQAAGGDVLEIDLVDRGVIDRTTNLPPLVWKVGGLAFGDGFGVAVSNRGLFRFDSAPDARAQRVALGSPAPNWYSGELVTSPNRAWVATTAGASELAAHVFVLAKTGLARRVTEAAAHLSGAGFLPDALGGPFLAVTDDGGAAAWRVEGATREVFLGKVTPPPGQHPVQVSSDLYFTDTLDEVVTVLAAQVGKFLFAVGARGTGGAIENADVFLVTLDATGAPVFENVTRTSGDLQPPFLQTPELAPAFVRALPEAGGLLVWDEQSHGTGRLLKVLPDQPGLHVLLDDVKSIDFAAPVGDELALSVVRRFANNDPRQLLRVPRDLSTAPVELASTNLDVAYLYPVTRGDGWLAFLARPEFGPESVQRIDVFGGELETLPLGTSDYGEVLGLSPAGALLVSKQVSPSSTRFFTWPFDAALPIELAAPQVAGHFVPGR